MRRRGDFAGDKRGGVAVIFVFGLLGFLTLAVGVIDLYALSAERTRLQDAADAAALAGAQQLRIAETGVQDRVAALLDSNLTEEERGRVSTRVEVIDSYRIKVTMEGRRPSFFANLLPPGGWKLYASSVAEALNMAPLCMLAHDGSNVKTLHLMNTARIDARSCLIHSNGDLVAEGSSAVEAALVHTVKDAVGRVIPAASTDSAPIPDPFVDLDLTRGICTDLGLDLIWASKSLKPGVHCGIYQVAKGQTLTLEPGEHHFANSLINVKEDGTLYGRDVVLILDKNSKVKFQDDAKVDLEGRKSGPLSGFLLITSRENTKDLELLSDNIDNLLGVVYAPSAKLQVDGKAEMAEDSDWTVVVAKTVELKGSARLKLNANYTSSLVPVPEGVGPNVNARLAD